MKHRLIASFALAAVFWLAPGSEAQTSPDAQSSPAPGTANASSARSADSQTTPATNSAPSATAPAPNAATGVTQPAEVPTAPGDEQNKSSATDSEKTGSLGGICSATRFDELALIFVVGFCYWFAMVVIRWHRVAQPSRQLLRAEIACLRTELDLLPGSGQQDDPPDWRNKIAELIDAAGRELSPKAIGKSAAYRLSNFLFWSRGQEITGWSYIHRAEVRMAEYYRPEMVVVRLEGAEQELRGTNDAPSSALAERIKAALTANPPVDLGRLRAMLSQALEMVYDRTDNSFSDLISWQNKASWLVGCGVFLLFVVTFALPHHSVLLIVGGVGGLVSRMSRSLNRENLPTDYGASWTTLFLSPVSGALGAWAGILLCDLAAQLNILGPLFKANFVDPCDPKTLAIAFVFGFSERLLDGVLDKLEEKTGVVPARVVPAVTTSATVVATAQAPAAFAITTDQDLPNGTVGQDYSQELAATGSTGTVTWSVTDQLPDGLQLSPAGVISGQPGKDGTFNFTVQVADQSSTTPPTKQFTLVIDPAPVATGNAVFAITTATLPDGIAGQDYNQQLVASGATGDVTWSLSQGLLPDGLVLSPTGTITGKPNAAGVSSFTVSAKDASGVFVTAQLAITVSVGG